MMMKRGWLFLVGICLFTHFAQSATPKVNRSFSLDLGYLPPIGSNQSFHNFGHELEDFGSFVMDYLGEKTPLGHNPLTRAALGTGMFFLWRFAQNGFFLANHEYGHGTRATAGGGTATYYFEGGGAAHGNIFTYWLLAIPNFGGGYTESAGVTTISNYWGPILTAGGVNNSSMMAEFLENEMLRDRGHILSAYLYQKTKLDTYDYVNATLGGATINGLTGDMDGMVSHYASQGHTISLEDMRLGSAASLFLSATTYSYLYSVIKYLVKGDPTVKSPHLGKWRLPNVGHYLNAQGIAFKVNTGWTEAKVHYPLSVEVQYLGKFGIEAGFGRKVEEGLSWMVYGNTFPAFGARGTYAIKMGSSGRFTLGLALYQLNLFEGQRNSQKNLSSDFGGEAIARYSFLY